MRDLNSLESRRGRKPLDVNNVIYWFKNTRAAVKRAEMKTRALHDTFMSPVGSRSVASATTTASSSSLPGYHWPWLAAASTSLLGAQLQKRVQQQPQMSAAAAAAAFPPMMPEKTEKDDPKDEGEHHQRPR